MHIYVKRKHIKAGVPGNIHLCPIAKAVREQLGTTRGVSVECGEVLVGRTKFTLPGKAIRFVDMFDLEYNVKPFGFELEEA